ncbi:MAG: efflux RND transporter periplasmic adaptor subunit [Planctomycetota bacterium]
MFRWLRAMILPGLAIFSLGFALVSVVPASQDGAKSKPPIEPARTPFADTVAGAGIVEPSSENILLGTHIPGVVAEVFVRAGQQVKRGQPLFRIDDRQLRAELKVHLASLRAAEAQLSRLRQLPRPEEIPVSEAAVGAAKARLAEQEDLLARSRKLKATRSVGDEEHFRREQEFRAAEQELAKAKASLDLLRAGAWVQDIEVAQTQVEQARAQWEKANTEIERLTVNAPVDGDVLQVNVRPGESVGASPSQALIVLGEAGVRHVRVDIDEHDIPRFRIGAPARANLRGDQNATYNLRFVRVEPYVVPKKSLTGDNTERVDTRVLQVIYAIEPSEQPLYVGQQLDVYVDLKSVATASAR